MPVSQHPRKETSWKIGAEGRRIVLSRRREIVFHDVAAHDFRISRKALMTTDNETETGLLRFKCTKA